MFFCYVIVSWSLEQCQNCGVFFVLFCLCCLCTEGRSARMEHLSFSAVLLLPDSSSWVECLDEAFQMIKQIKLYIFWGIVFIVLHHVFTLEQRERMKYFIILRLLLSSCIFALLAGFVVCLFVFFGYGKFWGKIGLLISRYFHRTFPELLMETQTTSLHFFQISLSHY